LTGEARPERRGDARELALRVEELRFARGVKMRDLAGAVGVERKALQEMLLARSALP
jgi:transcriptional regulator with XRE-family HTH domain